jgi:RNA polymerase sigma-70 factor (sigma-E family)
VTIDLAEEPVTGTRAGSFEELVAMTGDRMLRTAVLLTGDRHEAEDLVQSAYAQAFARWRLVARAENPVAYVRTILTRLFLADRRRKRVAEVAWTPGTDVAAPSIDPALRLSLLDALATLSAEDRALLVLRYFEDLPFPDVAGQLGLSHAACRTRASRALARLRLHFPDLADQA